MHFKIHPVTIPAEIPVCRNSINNLCFDNQKLTQKDLLRYDSKTIFYDIFFSLDNSALIGIGPPLLNLKHEIPITLIQLNGRNVRFSLSNINPKTTILYAKVNKSKLPEINHISIRFGDIWTCDRQITKNQLNPKANDLTLSTLQKDNEISWIKDWIQYYKNIHRVDRFILYDNGSKYQSYLEEKLHFNNINLHIVNWNFPFGPSRSHRNKFCQVGALNHCRLRFGNGGYFMNFDIDELLVIKSGSIFDLKDKSITYFDSYMVPFTKLPSKQYSFSSFKHREPSNRQKAFKYVYRANSIYENGLHKATTLNQRRREIIWEIIEKAFNKLRLPILFPTNSHKKMIISHKKSYFLHYSAITNGWKSKNRLHPIENGKNLVEDLSVIKAFKSFSNHYVQSKTEEDI